MKNYLFFQAFKAYLPLISGYARQNYYQSHDFTLGQYDCMEAVREIDIIIACIRGLLERFGISISVDTIHTLLLKLLSDYFKT